VNRIGHQIDLWIVSPTDVRGKVRMVNPVAPIKVRLTMGQDRITVLRSKDVRHKKVVVRRKTVRLRKGVKTVGRQNVSTVVRSVLRICRAQVTLEIQVMPVLLVTAQLQSILDLHPALEVAVITEVPAIPERKKVFRFFKKPEPFVFGLFVSGGK
jgi:hypothetical protein